MAEKIASPEIHNLEPSPERLRDSAENSVETGQQEKQKQSKESIAALRQEIAHNAAPASETTSKQAEHIRKPSYSYLDRKVKAQKFEETMSLTRKRLSKPGATFSKIIHAPVVEKVSEAAGQTIGRPSALLGGGMFAAIGVVAISWYAKHNGFALSGFEFILLVIAGMLTGIILEFLSKFIRSALK